MNMGRMAQEVLITLSHDVRKDPQETRFFHTI